MPHPGSCSSGHRLAEEVGAGQDALNPSPLLTVQGDPDLDGPLKIWVPLLSWGLRDFHFQTHPHPGPDGDGPSRLVPVVAESEAGEEKTLIWELGNQIGF